MNTFNPEKNIKLATYASRCIENEILMYLRKTSQQRNEISIDEPLNIDWDGNELLLSDVIGTDSDEVGSRLESEVKTMTNKAAIPTRTAVRRDGGARQRELVRSPPIGRPAGQHM